MSSVMREMPQKHEFSLEWVFKTIALLVFFFKHLLWKHVFWVNLLSDVDRKEKWFVRNVRKSDCSEAQLH